MKLPTRADCEQWDHDDPLAAFRERFVLPDGVIYLDGNSLGALPKDSVESIAATVSEQWGQSLIRSWNEHDWINLPEHIGALIAPLIGARPHEVIACDSTSVNLFKLLCAALKQQPGRSKIISERDNFPTDLYIMQGITQLFDGRVQLQLCEKHELGEAIDEDTAVVALTHVDYRSGEVFDMEAITRRAHQQGALMLWDLAHSAGALPVELNRCEVDLAIGCGYKYLNGGPGAPAFLYVAEHLLDSLPSLMTGWMGHAAPFDFAVQYRPDSGIRRFTCGTPQILGMVALAGGVQLMAQADIHAIRHKSRHLGDLFLELLEHRLTGRFDIVCPRDSKHRGSQVSLAHAQGYAIMQALIAAGVIGDFRAPNILRFGFTPLYLRYIDIWDAIDRLHDIMLHNSWDRPEFKTRAQVT
jgi:kynureninase